MQSKAELESWYQTEDPWAYRTNPDDIERKQQILEAIPKRTYRKALDIGCGEGWGDYPLRASKRKITDIY